MTLQLEGKRIALIGGAGFVGHHIALDLSRKGAQVALVDSLMVNNLLTFSSNTGQMKDRELYLSFVQERLDLLIRAGVMIHIQDARDYHALTRLLDSQVKPDVLIHLAAVAHAGKSNKDPWSTFDHSLRTLENSLDYARSGGVKHFIYLSSSLAYGNFQTEEADEEHPLNPLGIYGALKVAGEKIVIAYQQVFDLPYTIIRPSALYGPRCVSRRVSQIFIENALQGKPLKIEGDGSDRLDFTHINDLVNGLSLVIRNPAARNQIFNLTYGQGRSLQEIASIVLQRFPNTPVEYIQRDALMPQRGTLSIAKAKRLLGFTPEWPIERGVADYIDWYRTRMEVAPRPVPSIVER